VRLQCQCESESHYLTHFHLGVKVLSVSKIVAMTTLVVQHSENYYYYYYYYYYYSHSQHLKITFYFLFPSFPGLLLLHVPSSSWGKIFRCILSSSILSMWPNQRILCPYIHFTIFSPLIVSSSSPFVRLFHSPFSYLGSYILLNIFLSKISRACTSFFVNVHVPLHTTLPVLLVS